MHQSINLQQHLENLETSPELITLFLALANATKEIGELIRSGAGNQGKQGTQNSSGEEQIALDVQSNDIVGKHLKAAKIVNIYASEELENEIRIPDGGKFAVSFDPLDGSSLADCNLSIGSIFGIFESNEFIGITGRDQKAALIATYGPNTSITLTARNGVHYYTLIDNEFVLIHENITIDEEKKYFAPGNLRATTTEENYIDLMNFWMTNEYKLRYSGGMVPDINHILIKGGGIFCYPGYAKAPQGKLRVLYECAPMALLVTEAGGAAYANQETEILDIPVDILAQKTPIFIGSKNEVKQALNIIFK